MVTICIPVYNYDVRPLITELTRQITVTNAPCEVIIFDDASSIRRYQLGSLEVAPPVEYKILPGNIGRAAIRNLLAREAKHPYVIFLDADCLPDEQYINNYLSVINEYKNVDELIVIGGHRYAEQPPEDHDHLLHWWYGTTRETATTPHARDPFAGFHGSNFLVSRSLMLQHPFPENSRGYGHEDTLWGQQLSGKNVTLRRIANPVVHLGLERRKVWLTKQREATENLRRLRREHPNLTTRLTELSDRVPLIKWLARLVPEAALLGYLEDQSRPDFRALDLLKLKWYHHQ